MPTPTGRRMCAGCIPSVDSDIPEPLRPTAFRIHDLLCPLDQYYLTPALDDYAADGWDLELWADADESPGDQYIILVAASDLLPADLEYNIANDAASLRPVLLIRARSRSRE